MELTVTLYLSIEGERILKETNWIPDITNPAGINAEIDDLIKTGLIYKEDDGSVHLTDVGQDILAKLK